MRHGARILASKWREGVTPNGCPSFFSKAARSLYRCRPPCRASYLAARDAESCRPIPSPRYNEITNQRRDGWRQALAPRRTAERSPNILAIGWNNATSKVPPAGARSGPLVHRLRYPRGEFRWFTTTAAGALIFGAGTRDARRLCRLGHAGRDI